MKILFSNLGYAKGISGSLHHHLTRASHHVYTPPKIQEASLQQFRDIIDQHQPDICCMVEVDRGSLQSGYFNQIKALMCDHYCEYDIADKYGEQRIISRLPFHGGKSGAFIARQPFAFKRHYFSHGAKRLIYEISLPENRTLFFTHFSLQYKIRKKQFKSIHSLIKATQGEVILLGDLNILKGTAELQPLLDATGMRLLNDPDTPTFTFHRRRLMLDACVCSASLAEAAQLHIIPQDFSDHAALLLNIESMNTTTSE